MPFILQSKATSDITDNPLVYYVYPENVERVVVHYQKITKECRSMFTFDYKTEKL